MALFNNDEEQVQQPTVPIVGALDYSGIPGAITGTPEEEEEIQYTAPEAVQPYIAQAKAEGKDQAYIEGLVTSYYNQNPDQKPYFGDEAVYDKNGELSVVGGKWGKFLNKYGGGVWDAIEDLTLRPTIEGLKMREQATAVGEAITGDFTPEEQERMIAAEEAMRNNALSSGEAREYAKYIEENGDTWGTAILGAAKYPTVALASVFSSMIGMTNKYSLGVAAGTGAATWGGITAAGSVGGPVGTVVSQVAAVPAAIRNAFSAGGASMDGLVSLPDYLREELEKDGIEPTDTNLAEAINSKSRAFKAAQARSMKRAGSIYAVNLLTFAGAGRAQKALRPKVAGLNSRLKVAVKGAVETGIQIPGEGVGELVAQIAAEEKVSPSEVILEAFGGLGDVAVSSISDQFSIPEYSVNDVNNFTEKEMKETVMKMTPEEFAEADISVKNDPELQKEIENIGEVKQLDQDYSANNTDPEKKKKLIALNLEAKSLEGRSDSVSKDKLKKINNEINEVLNPTEVKEGEAKPKPYKADKKIQKFVDDVLAAQVKPEKPTADAVQQVQGETKEGVLRDKGVEPQAEKKVKPQKTEAIKDVEKVRATIETDYTVDDTGTQLNYKTKDGGVIETFDTKGIKADKKPNYKPLDLSKSTNKATKQLYKRFGNEAAFLIDDTLPKGVYGRFAMVTDKKGNTKPGILISPDAVKDGNLDEVVAHESMGHMAKLALDIGRDSKKYGDLENLVLKTSYAKAAYDRIGSDLQGRQRRHEVFADAVGKILSQEGDSSLARKVWDMLKDFFKSITGDQDAKFRRKVRKYFKGVTSGKADVSKVAEGRASIEGDLNLTKKAVDALEKAGRADLVDEVQELEQMWKDAGFKANKIANAVKNDYTRLRKEEDSSYKWNKDDALDPRFQEIRAAKMREQLGLKAEVDATNPEDLIGSMVDDIVNNNQLSTEDQIRQRKILKDAGHEVAGEAITDALVDVAYADDGPPVGSLIELARQIGERITGGSFDVAPFDEQTGEGVQLNRDAVEIGAKLIGQLTQKGIIEILPNFKTKTANVYNITNRDALFNMIDRYGAKESNLAEYNQFQAGKSIDINNPDYKKRLISNGERLPDGEAKDVLKKYNSVKKKIDPELFGIVEKAFKHSKLYKDDKAKMRPYDASLKKGREIVDAIGPDGYYTTAHNYDWRGRIYDMMRGFNVQSNKIAKGLTRLEEVPLNQEAYDRLLMQAYDTAEKGLGGQYFQNPEDRKRVAKDHIDQWVDEYNQIKKDPENTTKFWENADEPIIFLSTIAEIARIEEQLAKGKKIDSLSSGLPIHSDATTSQGQQMTALIRDKEAAKLVNLVAGEDRRDFYLTVADEVWNGFEHKGKEYKPWTPKEPTKAEQELMLEVGNTLNQFARDAKEAFFTAKKEGYAGEESQLDSEIINYYVKRGIDEGKTQEDALQEAIEKLESYGTKKIKKKDESGKTQTTERKKRDIDRIATKVFIKHAMVDAYEWTKKNKANYEEATRIFWSRPEVYENRRSILKKPTMTQWYGAGMDTISADLAKSFGDLAKDAGLENMGSEKNPDFPIPWPFLNSFTTRAYLGNRRVFSGPAELVGILEGVTSFLNKNGEHNLEFKTKFNEFPFKQEYREPIMHRASFTNQDGEQQRISLAVGYSDKRNLPKARRSTPVNVIHSFDSQVPAYLGVYSNYGFLSIHDNFAAAPGNAIQMERDAKAAMEDLYSGNALEEWMREALTIDGQLLKGAEAEIKRLLDTNLRKDDGVSYYDREDVAYWGVEETQFSFGAPPANPRGNNAQASTSSPSESTNVFVNDKQTENTKQKACKL